MPGRHAYMLAPLLAICVAAATRSTPRDVANPRDARSGPAALCEMVNVVERAVRIDAVAFVGSATADTVRVAPGQYEGATRRPSTAARAAIYGLVMRVERLDRAAASLLGDALTSAGHEVVVVPWSFDASCAPVPWEAGARWMTPGTSAVLLATLRDRAGWVGGRPTFDVTPSADVYQPPRPRGTWTSDSILSASEFLSLYERLPSSTRLATSPDSAVAPVVQWQAENPEPARKPVARSIVDQLLFAAEGARYQRQPSFIAGTYRVVYRLPSGDSVAFFARTERHPHFANWSSSVAPRDSGPYKGRRIVGHGINAQADRSLGELPSQAAAHGRGSSLQGPFELLDAPISAGSDSAVYAGTIELDWAAQLLAPDEAIAGNLRAAAKRVDDIGFAQYERTGSGYLGRFVVTNAGRVYYEMRVDSAGAPILTVRAERISEEHMRPKYP
jgi:hypothetical protein